MSLTFSEIRPFIDSLAQNHSDVLDWNYVALPETLPNAHRFQNMVDQGHHAQMEWLAQSVSARSQPLQHWEGYSSACLLLWRYPRPLPPQPDWIAAYAHGPDYHRVIGQTLYGWCQQLVEHFPTLQMRPFVDTLPIAERELAAMAGLGWIGRNTLLIHPQWGSGFFIAGLLLSPPVEKDPSPTVFAKGCTHCRRCLEACPTQALGEDGTLDSRKCLSYLTIEHRGDYSETPKEWVGHTLFGCDICQTVCPYNQKHLKPSPSFWPTTQEEWLLKAPQGQGLSRMLRKTPLERAGRLGMIRNLEAWIQRNNTQALNDTDPDSTTDQ